MKRDASSENLYIKIGGKTSKGTVWQNLMNLTSGDGGEVGGDEAGEGDAEARINSEGVRKCGTEEKVRRLDDQIEAADRGHVKSERRRRESHRKEQL